MASPLRNRILNHAMKTQPVATPFWSEKDPTTGEELVDGHVAIQDLPGDIIMDLQESMKAGKISLKQFLGTLLVKSLIDSDLKEPIFPETDRDAVIGRGQSELTPLLEDVQAFFGLSKKSTIEDTKKNSETTPSDLPGLESAQPAFIKQ